MLVQKLYKPLAGAAVGQSKEVYFDFLVHTAGVSSGGYPEASGGALGVVHMLI